MMADRISSEHRSWNMSRIRGANTKPEMLLRSLLHRAGFRFRLHDKTLPGKPDIVLPKYSAAIFVHGCFWHRHAKCKKATTPTTRAEFWQAKFKSNVSRDAQNVRSLRTAGWRVFIVWECELENMPGKVLARLGKTLSRGA